MKNRTQSAPKNTPVVRAARRQKPQVLSQSLSRFGSAAAITAALLASAAVESPANVYYWDTDGSTAGNSTAGAGLGGTSTWDTSTSNWWDTTALTAWTNTSADMAIFSGAANTPYTVTLASGIIANNLSFIRSGYTLTGGDLTLAGAGAGLRVNLGESAEIASQISGSAGLVKTGGGYVRLSNVLNNYTGTTTISNGALVITDQAALGSDSSAVVVTGFNPAASTNLRGFAGGSLVLDGLSAPITFSRDLSLQGFGPISDRGGAVVSHGNNTLSGVVTMGQPFTAGTTATNLSTGIISANGTLNLSGTLNIAGTAGTTLGVLGGVNQAGVTNYNLTGVLAGTGTLSKQGAGTLFLNPSDTSGFSGSIRTNGSNAGGQSSIRITGGNVLGTRTAGGTGAVIDLNGGILEVLMDSPSLLQAGSAPANVFGRVSSTLFVDRGVGSFAANGTLTLGQFTPASNQTFTFGSRNGYGITFATAHSTQDLGNPITYTNNLQGGLLTFNGAFWGNNNNTASRVFTLAGNGNTLIAGDIIAAAAAHNHSFVKTGSGTVTVTGTASTLDGNVSVQGGTLALTDWRSINNAAAVTATAALNLGSGGTPGTVSIVGNNVALANLTTNRTINLAGTTGGATILANQTGTSPGLVLNGAFVHTAGVAGNVKVVTLGGTNTGDNTINGVIPNNTAGAAVNLNKIDGGTWQLAGSNTFTGTTTISNGTLKLKANAATSTILADASTVAFNAVNNFAGGTLQLVGQNSVANVETIARLNAVAGAGTIQLSPGVGGGSSASIVFSQAPAITDGATINIVGSNASNTVTMTGLATGLASPHMFFGGADFAYSNAGVLRAPIYGTDATFLNAPGAATLPAGQNNFNITGLITAQTTTTTNTLKFNGPQTLTLTGGSTLTVRGGAAGGDGGILATGGASTITGGSGVTTGGSGSLTVRVDGGSDTLTIASPLTSGTSGGLTKAGQGTLILTQNNALTGTVTINEGTIRLSGAGDLGGGNSLVIRQGAVLDLNGVTPTSNINTFNNNGVVTSGAAGPVTFTIGGSNGGGTSFGIIEDGLGTVSVSKLGTAGHAWNGLSTYTGSTTIDSTGIVTVPNLANGGSASGIGASSSAAGNLVFTGVSATQAYGGLSYTGTATGSTDRLFTFNGGQTGGVRIQANGVNNAPLIFSNPGALAFGLTAATAAQGLVLGGASTGDNLFNPQITDAGAGTAVTSVFKADGGVWHLGNSANSYTGTTSILGGVLGGTLGSSIPTASNLALGGGGVLLSTGSITRTVGTGANQLRWIAAQGSVSGLGGGFAAGDSALTVNLGSGQQWGAVTNGFVGGGPLILGSTVSLGETTIANDIELLTGTAASLAATVSSTTQTITVPTTAGLVLGQPVTGAGIPANSFITAIDSGTVFRVNNGLTVASGTATAAISAASTRTVTVNDNPNTGTDQAIISGVISGTDIGITKAGGGTLVLRGANTYTGSTAVTAGTLVISTLGNSASPGATSVGDSTSANTDARAVTLGNGGTGGAILQYVGTGETSDRKIRLNSTTGGNQIHADGTGPLILTNLLNDMTGGAKTLNLRGINAAGNMVTSQLSDNGGTLGITVDGSATWILTNPGNNYTGTTTSGAGALGIGDNAALGSSTLLLSNGNVFAYGEDRTLSNVVQLANNTTQGIIGDYSLNFTSPLALLASANNLGLNNNVAAGKTVTFAGATANSLTNASRTWTVDGSGTTVIAGDFTTTSSVGVNVVKTGDGVLQLNGTGSNFNQASQPIDIDRGTLRLGASEVIPNSSTASGGVILSPELGTADTAILDLNGFSETINSLTATTDGTAIIDNLSGAAATLTIGANNGVLNFGGGVGTYITQNSGGGALSIIKAGTTSATIPTGVTLNHSGTTGVTGGTFTVASPLNATSGLSVLNSGSTLALTGGLTTSSAVQSVVVENGGTLSLLDGAGNKLSNLTTLQLGSSLGSMTTLNLNVGDVSTPGDEGNTDLLNLLTGGTLSLFAGNQVTFNLTDIGLNPSETYDLLSSADGGLTTGVLGITDWILGATPGGFTSITLNVTDTLIQLQTGTLIVGTSYWRGLTNTTWNANANNWSTDKAGTTPAASIPGAGTDVVFAYDGVTTGTLVTTLEQNFKVNSLTFESGSNTPAAVHIGPGAVSTNRIEIAPQTSTAGIAITTGGPAVASIAAPVRLGANQTWEVADAGSTINLAGALLGEADVTKTGAGKVILRAASDATFNSGVTTDITISAGTLELTNNAALGNTVNANLANVVVNGGAFYMNSTAASTLPNPITLGGGTLSAGGATQTYSGTVNVSADSVVNMADSNGPVGSTARSVTLSGVVSGSGNLTIDSNNGASGGNQLNGTLTMNNAGNTWSGDLLFNRGTVTIGALASPSFTGNDVTFNSFGRLILQGVNAATLTRTGALTYLAGAIGEFNVDNTSGTLSSNYLVDQSGLLTLGSGGTGASARFNMADAASALNITGGVTLGGNSSISVSGGDADSFVTISSVIADGGSGYSLAVNDDAGGWGATNTILRLTGLNTFGGNLTVDSGVLEYDTVTNAGGSPSALGQGNAINMGIGAATLRFIGTTSQSTDRPITTTTGVATLGANGTGGASITYNGAITIGPAGDGSQIILTGLAGSEGIITGGITQTGDVADATVNGGTWTLQTGTSRIGDDLTVTGSTTVLNVNSGLLQVRDDVVVTASSAVNLNGSGVLSYNTPTLSGDSRLLIRDGATVTLGANDAIAPADLDALFIGQDADGAPATLNMGIFNQTLGLGSTGTANLILGERSANRIGNITGTGTLTVPTGNIDLLRGSISANLATTGTTALEKFGPGTVTLSGDNSGLASTGASIIYEGSLILDYTTSNTTKLRAASQLEMRGSDLTLNGNDSAATSQTVNGLTLGNNGASTITLNAGTGQDILLTLGPITRAVNASDGTVRFNLPAGTQSATHGITTTTVNNRATSNGILGGWATVTDGSGTFFARNDTNSTAGANIVAANTTVANNVAAWTTAENISDSTGFTGTLTRAEINSLRFNANGASAVNMVQGGILSLASGGILITSNVASGSQGIFGGTLASGYAGGTPEIIVTNDSTQPFEINADIRVNHAIYKSGSGVVELSGNNTATGVVEVQNGTLRLSGGNAIGDTALVNLSASRPTTLELLSNETIGRLQGGQRQTNSDYGTVAIGSNTLTIAQTGSGTTFNGFLTGSGNLVRTAGDGTTRSLALSNASTGFTGSVSISNGLLSLNNIGQLNASSFNLNKGGSLLFDNNGTTRSGTRVLDTTPITLNSADGTTGDVALGGLPRGLWFRTDQDSGTSNTEAFGELNLASGANYSTLEQSGGNNSRGFLTATNIVRSNDATFAIRGRALGSTSGTGGQTRLTISDATNQTAFIAAMVGGGSTAGSTLSIVPWAIGETMSANLGNNNMGNSLVTYTAARGLRPLDFATEYNTFAASSAASNVRESSAVDITGLAGTTINSLVLNHNDAATSSAASTINVTGTGAGQTLAVTSGAMLFTSNVTATAARNIVLSGFDDGITVGGTNEYVIHVVNPAATGGTTLTATIGSPLTSAADITKSGRGTLILNQVNTAGGGASRTVINEGILEIADLDNIGGSTGALLFGGGTLRLGAGFADDLSTRGITLLSGGGTLNTNGNNVTLAGSLGSGVGGLTKIGAGALTLNGASTFTGGLTLSAGTVAVGVNNATGVGGNLAIAGSGTVAPNITTLDLGTSTINHALVTTSGNNPQIVGTGTINATTGFFLNHTGNTTISAVLGGAGGLLKGQTNVVTLNGLNTYTGTTEIQAGTLTFDSIGNVGGGASALGNPSNTENGIIRTGLTTTSVTLNYTGTGHTSNRIIAMQGTTGGLTISQNSTASGALNLGVVQTEMTGAKTLTLSGTNTAANSIAGVHEGATGALAVTKSGAGTWVVNGANTYTGSTLVSGGVLRAGNSQSFGTVGTVTVQETGSVLELANAVNIDRPLTVGNNGNAKTLRLLSGATSGTYSGPISIAETTAGNFIVGVDAGGSLTASGGISSTGATALAGITKTGPGTLLLPTANTYRGVTAISDGIVNIQNAASLGATNEGTTVTAGATLQVEGGVAVGAEALTLNGAGETGQNGALVNISGTNSWAGTVTLASASTIATEDGSLTLNGNVTLGANTLTSTGDNGGNTVINGDISGTGGLTVNALSNAGHTLTLDPATTNSFTGATAINDNATLTAQGPGALGSTASVAINSGGTLLLAGSGDRINNAAGVSMLDGTFNTAGEAEELGSLTLSLTNTISIIDLAGTNLNNILSFAASNGNSWAGQLHIYNWSGITRADQSVNGSYLASEVDQIFFGNSTSGLTNSQLSSITFFSDSGLTSIGSAVWGIGGNGQIVPVPEPTGVAVGLALFGLAGWRERRRAAARRRDERTANRS